MLQAIRDRASGAVAWIIIILISIPFALWGVNQYSEGGSATVVATVNGQDITVPEWQRRYQEERAQLQAMLGGRMDPALFNETELRRGALDRMIDTAVLREASHDAGLRVANQALAQQIRSYEAFHRDGQFAQDLYEQQLNAQGMTPAGFEQRLREGLLQQQLQSGIAGSALLFPAERDAFLRWQRQERRAEYVALPRERVLAEITVDDAAIERYYQSHPAEFTIPERMTVDYVELSAAALADGIEVGAAQLQALYEEQKQRFVQEERRQARHILIMKPESDEALARVAAIAKGQAALARVRRGEAFEAVAKEVSEDPGSAAEGGDLGLFGRGVMTQAFEDAVFAMEPGAISDLVESEFGWHIIQLVKIEPEQTKSFEQAREDLTREYRQTEAEKLFYERADTLTNLAYDQPDTLVPIKEALGLEIKTSAPFSRTAGEGIAAERRVRDAAFGDEVYADGYNSEALEIEPKHLVVLRRNTITPAAQKPLAEVHDEIVQKLKVEQAQRRLAAQAADWVGQLNAGAKLAELAAQAGLEVKKTDWVRRVGTVPDPALVRATFDAAPPAAEAAAPFQAIELGAGDFAVLHVTELRAGDLEAIGEDERKAATQALQRALGMADFEALKQAFKAQAEIEVRPDRLDL